MAKANGWNGCEMGVQVNGSSSSKYSRGTELRRVEDKDIYRLAKILDENACWRKLMSIIPKSIDVQACSAAGCLNFPVAIKKGFKYTAQDVFQIDEAANRLSPDQSKSQMMIDEWKTSGKLNERPTVGVLLQLLVQAELFSAADFVAEDFLNESKPARPVDGPGAIISLELLDEDMDVDNDGLSPSFQPSTTALEAVAQGSVGLNLDIFDKNMVARDKSVPQPFGDTPPVAPPRRPPRAAAIPGSAAPTSTGSSTLTTPNLPNLTILNPSEQIQEPVLQPRPQNIPNLSILMASSNDSTTTFLDNPRNPASSTLPPNIPRITLLIDNSAEISPRTTHGPEKAAKSTTPPANLNNLPMISALNITNDNGETSCPDSSSTTSSLSNDDDGEGDGEYADASLPNLSNSEQHNSNNDSSLTTVTGTSGDNSFELTNDSSSTSNDDYACNIPNLSELQQ
ncbi:protein Tube [Drosophila subpulchrella]|uniref:protein Tube n=1 Tax=Drosophila subpulchrella TaxID=1486046 RepID=UPI0018A179EB|nr:protein Tube [Drosophila subpulchrella]